jgi:crotonobetaine/carnitine-CoA ligase
MTTPDRPAATVDAQLRAAAADSGDRRALLFDDQAWTFAEIDEAAARVANWVDGAGIEPGEHVAVFMANRPEFIFAWTGAARIGRPVVAVNAGLKGDGLTYILEHSDAVAIVVEDVLVAELDAVLPALGNLRCVVVVGDEVAHHHIRWDDVMASPAEVPNAVVHPDDVMMLMYTSGTTGLPKGVVLTQSRCVGTVPILRAAGVGPDDIGFTCLPFFHGGAALVMFWGCHGLRIPLAISRRFSASRHWDLIRQHEATFFNALGSIIPILMKQPASSDDDNPCRIVISAGCPKDQWQDFEARFGVDLFEWYATVEGGVTLAGPDAPVGSIGKPIPGITGRIIRDDGTEAAPNEIGELVFRPEGSAATVAYYKNDTAAVEKTRDGWLHTGDRVYADGDGFLWYVDRGAHFIRRSGENISSAEVEIVVNAHPLVLESAAYGLASPLGEDDVAVAVVLQPDTDLTPEALIKFCQDRLARFQVPRYVRFVGALPKTATEKTQNLVLRDEGVTPDTFDREATVRKVTG